MSFETVENSLPNDQIDLDAEKAEGETIIEGKNPGETKIEKNLDPDLENLPNDLGELNKVLKPQLERYNFLVEAIKNENDPLKKAKILDSQKDCIHFVYKIEKKMLSLLGQSDESLKQLDGQVDKRAKEIWDEEIKKWAADKMNVPEQMIANEDLKVFYENMRSAKMLEQKFRGKISDAQLSELVKNGKINVGSNEHPLELDARTLQVMDSAGYDITSIRVGKKFGWFGKDMVSIVKAGEETDPVDQDDFLGYFKGPGKKQPDIKEADQSLREHVLIHMNNLEDRGIKNITSFTAKAEKIKELSDTIQELLKKEKPGEAEDVLKKLSEAKKEIEEIVVPDEINPEMEEVYGKNLANYPRKRKSGYEEAQEMLSDIESGDKTDILSLTPDKKDEFSAFLKEKAEKERQVKEKRAEGEKFALSWYDATVAGIRKKTAVNVARHFLALEQGESGFSDEQKEYVIDLLDEKIREEIKNDASNKEKWMDRFEDLAERQGCTYKDLIQEAKDGKIDALKGMEDGQKNQILVLLEKMAFVDKKEIKNAIDVEALIAVLSDKRFIKDGSSDFNAGSVGKEISAVFGKLSGAVADGKSLRKGDIDSAVGSATLTPLLGIKERAKELFLKEFGLQERTEESGKDGETQQKGWGEKPLEEKRQVLARMAELFHTRQEGKSEKDKKNRTKELVKMAEKISGKKINAVGANPEELTRAVREAYKEAVAGLEEIEITLVPDDEEPLGDFGKEYRTDGESFEAEEAPAELPKGGAELDEEVGNGVEIRPEDYENLTTLEELMEFLEGNREKIYYVDVNGTKHPAWILSENLAILEKNIKKHPENFLNEDVGAVREGLKFMAEGVALASGALAEKITSLLFEKYKDKLVKPKVDEEFELTPLEDENAEAREGHKFSIDFVNDIHVGNLGEVYNKLDIDGICVIAGGVEQPAKTLLRLIKGTEEKYMEKIKNLFWEDFVKTTATDWNNMIKHDLPISLQNNQPALEKIAELLYNELVVKMSLNRRISKTEQPETQASTETQEPAEVKQPWWKRIFGRTEK